MRQLFLISLVPSFFLILTSCNTDKIEPSKNNTTLDTSLINNNPSKIELLSTEDRLDLSYDNSGSLTEISQTDLLDSDVEHKFKFENEKVVSWEKHNFSGSVEFEHKYSYEVLGNRLVDTYMYEYEDGKVTQAVNKTELDTFDIKYSENKEKSSVSIINRKSYTCVLNDFSRTFSDSILYVKEENKLSITVYKSNPENCQIDVDFLEIEFDPNITIHPFYNEIILRELNQTKKVIDFEGSPIIPNLLLEQNNVIKKIEAKSEIILLGIGKIIDNDKVLEFQTNLDDFTRIKKITVLDVLEAQTSTERCYEFFYN